MDHPAWGLIRQVGIPFELSATPASIRIPPPLLGQDTDAILADLGYDAAEIAGVARGRRHLALRPPARLELAPPERPGRDAEGEGDEDDGRDDRA